LYAGPEVATAIITDNKFLREKKTDTSHYYEEKASLQIAERLNAKDETTFFLEPSIGMEIRRAEPLFPVTSATRPIS
jgi:hypothetical protein